MRIARREALKTIGAAALAATAGPPASRADDPPAGADLSLPELMKVMMPAMVAVPITAAPLGPGLTLLQGPGGNVAVLTGGDGTLLVDSFIPQRSADLRAAVAKVAPGPIPWLINTHWHFDHTGGNLALASAGAKILGHQNTRSRLGSDQYNEAFDLKMPASPEKALPVIVLGEDAGLFLNGEELRLVHVPPAHTDGDIYIHFVKADVLHAGDLFSNGFYPNIDGSSAGWIGGMVAAADKILGIAGPKTRIIPGHGPLATRDDLKAARDMLDRVWHAMAPMVEAGKTIDEVVAAKPTKPLDDRWGKGLFRGSHFARVVYIGLANHAKAKDASR